MGSFKLFAGSFLTYLALRHGLGGERAAQPAELYHFAFLELFHSPRWRWRSQDLCRRLPTQNQCHKCLCRLDRLVEFLLTPDAQAIRAGWSG